MLQWGEHELEQAWAAGIWIRAFNAKKRIAFGMDPAPDFTPAEAERRLRQVHR